MEKFLAASYPESENEEEEVVETPELMSRDQ
jgi:hypothetical protein